MAERQGFEPWRSCDLPVFKTGAFDHSAISPDVVQKAGVLYGKAQGCQNIFFAYFTLSGLIFREKNIVSNKPRLHYSNSPKHVFRNS